ncbi:peptidase domain-containing ABC transporter [Balneolales bacterium ANBcel1]|nr:peptidase domain-containing ABC transporter [Balneolales bacterium ANBcel1]
MKALEKLWIRQHDQSDCGVACLASVIRYYGGEAGLEKLREESGTTISGTTLLGLFQAAPKFGLIAEPYEADIPNLKEQTDPCILHIVTENHLQHFVVYFGFDGDYFLISDPAEGVKKWREEELEAVWKSKALLLLKKGDDFATNDATKREKWGWIRNLAEEDIPILGVAVAIGLFIAALGLTTAIFTQKLIDEFLPDEDTLKLFVGLGLLTFLLLVRNGLSWMRELFLIRQSRDFNNRMIQSFYGSLLRLPMPFFHNRKTGDLIARMNDTRRLQSTITYLIGDVIIDVLLVITAAVFIMYYSVFLGLFILLSLPVFYLLTWKFHAPIRDGQKEVMKAHALNESNYVDTIQGIAAIKESNRERFFSSVTKQVYGHFQNTIFDLGKVGIRFSFWADTATVVFVAGVFAWGSVMVLNGDILLGALIAVIQMSGQLIPSANRLALTNLQIQEARVAFDRMYEFASLKSEYNLNGRQAEVEEFEFDALDIRNLSFRFPGRSPLLKEVSLNVKKGEVVGILGESGCGKTTILHILKRFYQEESGDLVVNHSKNLSDIPVPVWRGCVASVPQEIKIFNAPLIQNISLGDITKPEDIEKVIAFCNKSGLGAFFESFPQGYATLLGEEGVNISGGQKQLVALARALYQKPQLLLLDEPTSAMDRETEKTVLDLLTNARDQMAVMMVTHRVQSIKYADRIYILENGIIDSQGSPRSLLQTDNLYSRAVRDV